AAAADEDTDAGHDEGRLLEHDAGARHHGAEHPGRLAATLQRVLDVVVVLAGHDHHHADAHVERAEHLVVAHAAALLDEAEERRYRPGLAAQAHAEALRQHAG